jgi:hypothetical protein
MIGCQAVSVKAERRAKPGFAARLTYIKDWLAAPIKFFENA